MRITDYKALMSKAKRLSSIDKTKICIPLWITAVYSLLMVAYGYWDDSAKAARKVSDLYETYKEEPSLLIDHVKHVLRSLIHTIETDIKKAGETK